MVVEMANKSVFVSIVRICSVLMEIPALNGYEESRTFSIGYGDEYVDVHIPDIIPVSAIFMSHT